MARKPKNSEQITYLLDEMRQAQKRLEELAQEQDAQRQRLQQIPGEISKEIATGNIATGNEAHDWIMCHFPSRLPNGELVGQITTFFENLRKARNQLIAIAFKRFLTDEVYEIVIGVLKKIGPMRYEISSRNVYFYGEHLLIEYKETGVALTRNQGAPVPNTDRTASSCSLMFNLYGEMRAEPRVSFPAPILLVGREAILEWWAQTSGAPLIHGLIPQRLNSGHLGECLDRIEASRRITPTLV